MTVNKDDILKLRPFDCSNWDELCNAVIDAYSPEWNNSLVWILGGIRYLKAFEKHSGSWNVPFWFVSSNTDVELYKLFRKPKIQSEHPLVYEFHPAPVVTNKWMEAAISGSARLTGLSEGHAKFHMLANETQAQFYLDGRKNCTAFSDHEPYVCKVKARNLMCVDLIYVPPTRFVWGVDAKEMFVTYE